MDGPTDCFAISRFCPLELDLERGYLVLSLAAFAVKVSNIISLKVINLTWSGDCLKDPPQPFF
jgi:hypothetical protein